MDHVVPIAGLDELDRHLDALLALPATAATTTRPPLPGAVQFDPALFDAVELQLTEANIPALVPRLLPKIVGVLQNPAAVAAGAPASVIRSEANAAVLCSIATKLLGPVSFADALSLASEASLVAALSSDAAAATNVLAINVIHKAATGSAGGGRRRQGAAADIARLAAMDDLVAAFIVRWLASPSVEVGERGGRVLGDLLDVDCPLPPVNYLRAVNGTTNSAVNGVRNGALNDTTLMTATPPPPSLRNTPGEGRLWRRLLHDRAVYTDLLLGLCRGTHPAIADEGHPHQQSIAQGRVLRLLPRLAALNLAEVATTGVEGQQSLLQYAALHMVDTSDVLMHLSLLDFYETLVTVMRIVAVTAGAAGSGGSVDYIIDVLRTLLRTATAQDAELLQQLQTLPDRMVPEEADVLRDWLRQLLPAAATVTMR